MVELTHCCILCSNKEQILQGINTPASVFKNSGNQNNFTDLGIKNFLNKLFVQSEVNLTVSKQKLIFVLPQIG